MASHIAGAIGVPEKIWTTADLSSVIAPITALIFLSQKFCGLHT